MSNGKTLSFNFHLAITVGAMTLFVGLAILGSLHYFQGHLERAGIHERFESDIHLMASRLEDLLERLSPDEAIDRMTRGRGPAKGKRTALYLLDSNLKLLASNRNEATFRDIALTPAALPQELSQVSKYYHSPFTPMPAFVTTLSSEPRRYLALVPEMGPEFRGVLLPAIWAATLLAAILSAGASLGLMLFFLKSNAQLAAEVMSRLRKGDLKARIPVRNQSESGRLMHQFNLMADEIERLVLAIRETEQKRIELLQEIGHDIRTPLASLRGLVEILVAERERLPPETQQDLLSSASGEVVYLSQLVEDLLLLARVESPAYVPGNQSVDCVALLRKEIGVIEQNGSASGKRVELVLCDPPALVRGDHQLIQRLFRNALQNACSFARKNVMLNVRLVKAPAGDFLEVQVDDDGPGFPAGSLGDYGVKRPTRVVHEEVGTRISLGLGSVIIKTIVGAHQGELVPSNREEEDGEVQGARLSIRLPAA